MSGDRKAWAGSLLCPPGPHGLSFTFRIQSILVPVNAPEAGTKPLEGRPSACGDPPATPPLVFEPRPLTPVGGSPGLAGSMLSDSPSAGASLCSRPAWGDRTPPWSRLGRSPSRGRGPKRHPSGLAQRYNLNSHHL